MGAKELSPGAGPWLGTAAPAVSSGQARNTSAICKAGRDGKIPDN